MWALVCAVVAAATVSSCKASTKSDETQESIGLSKLNLPFRARSQTIGEYFPRQETESIILKHIGDEPSRVLVLFGARNLGKSSVLDHVLAHDVQPNVPRKGVVVVKLDTAKGIDKEVARAFGGSPDSLRDSRAFVKKVCEQFYAENHYRPVIVFATTGNNRIVGNDALALAAALREFSCETQAAVCIANLHDLETAQSFPRDGRMLFVTVPELTKEQAGRYLGDGTVEDLAQRGVTIDQVIDGIGGNPTLLNELRFAEDPVAYLRGTVQQANLELQEAIELHPVHSRALVALSKAPYEAGLSLKDYSAASGVALTVAEIGKVHKNVVFYDFQNKTVKFRSRSLHAAQVLLRGWFR